MARILFIESELRNEKLGIMYLSAALKTAGHATCLCWLEKEPVEEMIASFSPDFLAFSLTTGAHRTLLDTAARLKERYRLPVIVGGPHATFFAETIPSEAADFVVVGQGERAIVDIAAGTATDRVLRYPLADLESMAFPDRELFYRYAEFRDNPMKNVMACRDCPYSCSYCYNHTWKGLYQKQPHFLQKRSVSGVLAEIVAIRADYNLEQVLFIDDNFLLNAAWVEEFCDRYPREIGLPFLCSCSLNLLSEPLVMKLKAAGLSMVNFALESADPAVQREILSRGHVTNDQIVAGIELLRRYGIKSRMQNMIGLPVAAPLAEALNTLAFNRANRVDDSWVSIFQPYPNTRLATYCLENGFIENESAFADNFFSHSCLTIDHAAEIRRLQKWWYFIVKYDIENDAIRALLEIDFDEETGEKMQQLRYAFSRQYLYGLNADNPQLHHDLADQDARFGNMPAYSALRPLIAAYGLCAGLTELMMTMPLPETFHYAPRETHAN